MNKPIIIALCGVPKSGKTLVQQLLHKHWGVVPWDDGDILRQHLVEISGLPIESFTTQEGKSSQSVIGDVQWEHRRALGEYGNALERMFGDQIIAHIACRRIFEHFLSQGANLGLHARKSCVYSCASVRKNQGVTYKSNGGIVVEVLRDSAADTGNGFDLYNRDIIDLTIENHTTSQDELLEQIETSGLLERVGLRRSLAA